MIKPDKLKMQTTNKVNENIEKIAKLFPNALIETKINPENELAANCDRFERIKIQLFGISEQLPRLVQNFGRFYEKNKVELTKGES